MTRNDKLYDRVDDLIINFKELLKKELTKESNDCPSTYFSRKEDLFRYGPKAVGKIGELKRLR